MLSLISEIYCLLSRKPEIKILIIGPSGTGKTQLFCKIMNEYTKSKNLKKPYPTTGLNIGDIKYKNLKFRFWDLGGSDEVKDLWNSYLKDADVILMIFKNSFENEILKCLENIEEKYYKRLIMILNEVEEKIESINKVEKINKISQFKISINEKGAMGILLDEIYKKITLDLKLIKN